MAGREHSKFQRAFRSRLAGLGGWAYVFGRISHGETMTAVATTLEVSRTFLAHQLNDDPQLRVLLVAAREEGASALIDEALDMIRATPTDKDAISRDRMKADVLMRLASVLDPARYAEKKGPVVHVDIRDAHLSAVRRYNEVPHAPEPKALPLSGVEVAVDAP